GETTGKIDIDEETNRFVHFKAAPDGGNVIRLVEFIRGEDYDSGYEYNAKAHREAMEDMATRYNAFISYDPLLEQSAQVASSSGLDDVTASHADKVKALESILASSNSLVDEQVQAYFKATGLSLDKVSLAYFGQAVCIVPGAYYTGESIM